MKGGDSSVNSPAGWLSWGCRPQGWLHSQERGAREAALPADPQDPDGQPGWAARVSGPRGRVGPTPRELGRRMTSSPGQPLASRKALVAQVPRSSSPPSTVPQRWPLWREPQAPPSLCPPRGQDSETPPSTLPGLHLQPHPSSPPTSVPSRPVPSHKGSPSPHQPTGPPGAAATLFPCRSQRPGLLTHPTTCKFPPPPQHPPNLSRLPPGPRVHSHPP